MKFPRLKADSGNLSIHSICHALASLSALCDKWPLPGIITWRVRAKGFAIKDENA